MCIKPDFHLMYLDIYLQVILHHHKTPFPPHILLPERAEVVGVAGECAVSLQDSLSVTCTRGHKLPC